MHKTDEFGLPTDPKLRALEDRLCNLARLSGVNVGEQREKFIREYHDVMEKLYSLGWDGELDLECVLPQRFMPKEYLRRNPDWWYDDVFK